MSTAIIGIKELQNNLKRVADAALKGASFTVVRDSKPVFRIEPVIPSNRTGSLKDFLASATFSGEKNLSSRVDEIVYGNTR
jgi:antitoxin (DNA-binding transcriptional repressor) of toxin-antitoxin stability system